MCLDWNCHSHGPKTVCGCCEGSEGLELWCSVSAVDGIAEISLVDRLLMKSDLVIKQSCSNINGNISQLLIEKLPSILLNNPSMGDYFIQPN